MTECNDEKPESGTIKHTLRDGEKLQIGDNVTVERRGRQITVTAPKSVKVDKI